MNARYSSGESRLKNRTARRNAELKGQIKYHGQACHRCLGTLRYVISSCCVYCNVIHKKKGHDFRAKRKIAQAWRWKESW